jgi:hypothetical protein
MLNAMQSRLSVLIGAFLEENDFLASDLTCRILCNKLFDAFHQKKSCKHIYLSASEAREYLWEALHSKSWDEIDVGCKDAFGLITLIAATAYHNEILLLDNHIVHESQLTALIDSGVLLGSRRYHDELYLLVEEVQKLKVVSATGKCNKSAEVPVRSDFVVKKDFNRAEFPSFLSRKRAKSVRSSAIIREAAPSLVGFYNKFLLGETPAVLTGCMEDWGALEKWKSLDYYRKGSAGTQGYKISYLSRSFLLYVSIFYALCMKTSSFFFALEQQEFSYFMDM